MTRKCMRLVSKLQLIEEAQSFETTSLTYQIGKAQNNDMLLSWESRQGLCLSNHTQVGR